MHPSLSFGPQHTAEFTCTQQQQQQQPSAMRPSSSIGEPTPRPWHGMQLRHDSGTSTKHRHRKRRKPSSDPRDPLLTLPGISLSLARLEQLQCNAADRHTHQHTRHNIMHSALLPRTGLYFPLPRRAAPFPHRASSSKEKKHSDLTDPRVRDPRSQGNLIPASRIRAVISIGLLLSERPLCRLLCAVTL